MRADSLRRTISAVLTAFLLCALFACAGGGRTSPALFDGGPAANGDVPAGTAVQLGVAVMPAGTRLAVDLHAGHAAALYQLSCRLAFDPLALRPVSVTRGALADERAIFFSTVSAGGYVPVAFTFHPGESAPADSGVVARIEFEVLDAARAPGVAILSDPQFLIANDAQGQPLDLHLEVQQ